MKGITRILVLATVLLLAFAAPMAAGPDVPVKGAVMGEHTPPDFSKPGCPTWAVWRFSSEGQGKLSHLGSVGYELTQCTTPGPDGFYSEGTIRFVAANGDELFLEHIMQGELVGDPAEPDGFTMGGTWVAVGGTGRFVHATGSGTFEGVGDIPDGGAPLGIPDGLAHLDFTGRLSYTAADRSK